MLKKIKSYLPKGDFTKNVLTLITGTTIAQAIPIVASIVLARIYEPEDYGLVTVFVSISVLFSTIANGRYELALIIPEKDEDAINIFALGFIINASLSLLLLFGIILFHDSILTQFDNKEISFWLYFIPIVVFFVGLHNLLNHYNTRLKNYKDISLSKIVKAIVLTFLQITIGFLKKGAVGLFTGQIISHFFANVTLLKNVVRDKKLLAKISKEKILLAAKKYSKFPKYLMPSTFLNALSLESINFLILTIYKTKALGLYSFVNRVINLPTSLIGTSIGQVYYQEANVEYLKNKKTNIIFVKTLKKLFYISVPIFITMYFIVEPVFLLAYGEKYALAGVYAKIMVPLAATRFVSTALSSTVMVHQKLNYDLLFKALLLITSVVIFFVGQYLEIEFKGILTYYSLILSLEYLGFLLIYYRVSKKP